MFKNKHNVRLTMEYIINMNFDQITIPIEESNDFLIDVGNQSPVAHTRRDCPNAPIKEKRDNFPTYYYDPDFETEIDCIYRRAEETNAIQIDDGYFPLGARFLAGRKYYKTYSDGKIVNMKALLLLVKYNIGWLRTNVQMLATENDENEWDIEFISE